MSDIIKKFSGRQVYLTSLDEWPPEFNKTKIINKLIDSWYKADCPRDFEVKRVA